MIITQIPIYKLGISNDDQRLTQATLYFDTCILIVVICKDIGKATAIFSVHIYTATGLENIEAATSSADKQFLSV